MHARIRLAFLFLCAVPLLALAGCGGDISVALPLGGGGGDSTIYLFNPGLTSNGDVTAGVGTRAAIDAYVAGGTVPGVCSGLTVRAFITLNATDTIAGMPANLGVPALGPIYGDQGPLVADNWADLTDGTIQASMTTATGLGTYYWTGSNADGTASGNSCGNWASTSGNGTVGRGDLTNGFWMNNSASACGGASSLVLAICY